MQFRDLKAQYLALKPQIDRAIFDAVEEGRYISGPQVRELEGRQAVHYLRQRHRGAASRADGRGRGSGGRGVRTRLHLLLQR